MKEVPVPYVFLDATYCKARVNRRVVSQAVVVATGVSADGRREVLDFDVGDNEVGAFWTAFLKALKARGLGGVQLVIAAHLGLRAAVSASSPGHPCNGAGCTTCGILRPARRCPRPRTVGGPSQWCSGASTPRSNSRWTPSARTSWPPPLSDRALEAALVDQPARAPQRRTDVDGVFPNPPSLLRLAGAVRVEAHDEWRVSERRSLAEGSVTALLTPPTEEVATPSAHDRIMTTS